MADFNNYCVLARYPVPNRDAKHFADLQFGEVHMHEMRLRVMWGHFAMLMRRMPGIDASGFNMLYFDEIERGIGAPHAELAMYLDKFAPAAEHHDVKADAAVLRQIVEAGPLARHVELVHWAATSEDMSNIAWALLLKRASALIMERAGALAARLCTLAEEHADVATLAYTHGQPATPTTYGKRWAVFATKLERAIDRVGAAAAGLAVKCSGPTGTHAAARLVWPGYPDAVANWIAELGLKHDEFTHQCNNYDTVVVLLDALAVLALCLAEIAENTHRYIEAGDLQQTARSEYASASSVMPQKINPHMLESAGAHMRHVVSDTTWMKLELGQNRWERELHNHPPERHYGAVYAQLLVGIASVTGTLRGVQLNRTRIAQRLLEHPEVLSEAFNTVARAAGMPGEYAHMAAAMASATTPDDRRAALLARADAFPPPHADALRGIIHDPSGYVGLAKEDALTVSIHAAPVTTPASTRARPLLIINLNQTLLNTEAFLREHLATLTTINPEFDEPNFPPHACIHTMMRNRMPLRDAFEAWFPGMADHRHAQYLHRCKAHAAEPMPDGPRVMAALAMRYEIVVCTGSGTSSAANRLQQSGYTNAFEIVREVTPAMVTGRTVIAVTCNPYRPIKVPVIDPILLKHYAVVGLYTREECREHGYKDDRIAQNLTELMYLLK